MKTGGTAAGAGSGHVLREMVSAFKAADDYLALPTKQVWVCKVGQLPCLRERERARGREGGRVGEREGGGGGGGGGGGRGGGGGGGGGGRGGGEERGREREREPVWRQHKSTAAVFSVQVNLC